MSEEIILTHEQESEGKPSGSMFQRMLSCKASTPLTRMLRESGTLPDDPGSADASYGDKVHRYVEAIHKGEESKIIETITKEDDDAWSEAVELVEKTNAIVERIFGLTVAEAIDIEGIEVYIEKRFWWEGRIASAKLDFVLVDKRDEFAVTAIILDYKTGWNDTPQGAENAQVCGGAVLVHDLVGPLVECHVGIVEVGGENRVDVLYGSEIEQWKDDLWDALQYQTEDPMTLGFTPTDNNCRYCPARLKCPALHDAYEHALSIAPNHTEMIRRMDDSQLESLRDGIEKIKHLATAVDKEMEQRIRHLGVHFRGWHFAPGIPKRVFTNARAVLNKFLDLKPGDTSVFDIVKLGITDAVSLHKRITGHKGKAADSDFQAKFGDYIERPEGTPSIRKK